MGASHAIRSRIITTLTGVLFLLLLMGNTAFGGDCTEDFNPDPFGAGVYHDSYTFIDTTQCAGTPGLTITFENDGDGPYKDGGFGINDFKLEAKGATDAQDYGDPSTIERITVKSSDGKAFVFKQIHIDINTSTDTTGFTIEGIGPEPFTITTGGPGTAADYPASETPKLVTVVEISSVDFYLDWIDNLDYAYNVPGAGIYGNSMLIANGDTTPTAADHTDFGSTASGAPVDRTFTISSIGKLGLDLTGSSYVTVSNTTDFSVHAQPTVDPIPSGSTDTFTIRAQPSSAGEKTATVTIENDSEAHPYTFVVECTGTTPAPEIDIEGNSTSIPDGDTTPVAGDHTDFGDIAVGSNFDQTFTIQNEGNANLTLTNHPNAVAMSGSGDFSVHTQPGSGSVAPSGSVTFVVRCTPSATGDRAATVSVASNDSDEDPYTFTVEARGTAPEIDIEGNGVSIPNGDTTPERTDRTHFGSVAVGSSANQTFTIQNEGTAALTLTDHPNAVALSGSTDFSIHSQPSSGSIAASGSTTFVVRCAPSSSGPRTATVSIPNTDANEAPYTFTVGATGAVPEIEVSGNGQWIVNGDDTPSTADNTDFGHVNAGGGTHSHEFRIHNKGQADLTLDRLVELIPDLPPFRVDYQPAPLIRPFDDRSFSISFTPQTGRLHTATVRISNNDPDEDPFTFVIQGTGDAPEMDVTGQGISIPDNDTTPRTADDTEFGDLDILAPPIVHTFTIENAGTADLSLTGAPNRVTISDSVFTVTTQPGASVAPVGTTTFDISFDPAAIGEYTGTVTVANDDADENPYTFDVHGAGTSAPEIDVRGRGQSIADGDLTPSLDDDTAFGSVNVQGGIKTHVFTVHNVGSENLTLTDAPHAVQVDQAEFTVAAQPTSPIPPGGQATFDLTFDPDAAATTTATVSIANNDADEAPHTFRIQGTGLAPPSGGGGPAPSAAPTASTEAATHVTMTTATLRATVNPNMLGTNVSFECGAGSPNGTLARTLTAPYTDSVAAQPSPLYGLISVWVTAVLTDLEPNTTHHYRVVAKNDKGITYGDDMTFTTSGWIVGDVDDSGVIDLVDVRLCSQIATGARTGSAAERDQADVDGDGDVDMDDVIALSEYLLGIRGSLP